MSFLDDRPCCVFASFLLNLKEVPPYSFSDIPCPICQSLDFFTPSQSRGKMRSNGSSCTLAAGRPGWVICSGLGGEGTRQHFENGIRNFCEKFLHIIKKIVKMVEFKKLKNTTIYLAENHNGTEFASIISSN